MNKKLLVSLLSFLMLARSYLSFQAGALHLTSGGCGDSVIGGNGDEGAYSIAVTNDLGFVIAGYTKSWGGGGSDFLLLKYGPFTMTNILNQTITYPVCYWNRTYGGPEDDVAKSVVQTTDGGFALAGDVNSSNNGLDIWLVKTDSNGVMEWDVLYGGVQDEAANSLIQTKDGGYLLTGYVSSSEQRKSTFLIKTDGLGNAEWNQTLPGQGSNSVIESLDGNYTLSVNYPNAFGLVKVNGSGFTQVNKQYNREVSSAGAQSVVQADDGGYVLAGWEQNSNTSGTWLIKTDSEGILQWDRVYEKLGVYSMIKTIDGNYALTGDRACLIVTNSDGNLLFERTFDGAPNDGAGYSLRTYSVTETIENHFYMAGIDRSRNQSKGHYLLASAVLSADDTPPAVTVLSPENGKTYPSDMIPLTFFVNKTTRVTWYCLDGKNATLSGNTTLPILADGSHSITVYARDTAYNIGKSEPVLFSSETITFTIDSAITIAPPEDTTSRDNTPNTAYSVQSIIVAVAITATALAAATFMYYGKHKPNKQTLQDPTD